MWRALLIAFTIVSMQSCATRKPPLAITPSIGARQTGIASWYGHPYHGRATASGEIYDMDRDTAAHQTFAFGTWVRVDNLDNGKRTEVRINDRGPFKRGRIVDLSRAAARKIDMIGPGTAKVRLTVIAPPLAAPLSSSVAIPVPWEFFPQLIHRFEGLTFGKHLVLQAWGSSSPH
jgi:rare lipoprotein A